MAENPVPLHDYDPDPPAEAGREHFRIADLAQAAWAMRKLRQAQARIDEVKAVADAEIERVQAWAEAAISGHAKDRAYFEGLLVDYALRCREENPKVKSLALPGGRVATRESGGGWTAVDMAALVAWAEARHPDLVEVRKNVPLTAAKRALQAAGDVVVDPDSGEVVPGLAVGPKGITATVTLDRD
ncbi:MAG: host-nuclease inhibitor Gam family protein [Actinomycetota bacterium]